MDSNYYFKRKGIIFLLVIIFTLLFLFFSVGFLVGFYIERPVSSAVVKVEKGKLSESTATIKADMFQKQAKGESPLALQTKLTPASPAFADVDPPSTLPDISPPRQR